MGQAVSDFVNNVANFVNDKFDCALRQILPPVAQYVVQHPIRTAFHVVNGIIILAGSIVAGPLLGLAGFTATGIAGGTLAAALQSAMGPITAGGMFATLQSAAMGGYGAAAVAGTVSGIAAAAEGINVAVEVATQHDDNDEE